MQRLRGAGPVIYLKADLQTLERRVAAAPDRGIASGAGMTFADVFNERTPLYEKYADITIDATAGTPEQVTEAIIKALLARHT